MLLPGTPATAQSVTGTVVERGTGRPIMGALVRLQEEGAGSTAPVLTGADGRYVIDAPRPGVYRLLVQRIGYADTRTEALTLESGGRVARVVVVGTEAVELSGLVVEGTGRRCGLDAGDGGATAVLWAEIRKALDAASWTSREGSLFLRLVDLRRERNPRSLAVVEEDRTPRNALGGNSVRSLPADELAANGYVMTREDAVDYYAPDAEALLSDAFLEGHCFSVVPAADARPGRIGLAFEPVDPEGRPDVAGTVWIVAATGRLDAIEFSYTGLEHDTGDDFAGGRVGYAELPDGRWLVRDWHIRAPELRATRFGGAFGSGQRTMVAAVHETGAQVVSVQGADWRWTPDRPTVALSGVVFDSTTGAPLAGAVVRVAGAGWRSVADSAGAFHLSAVEPGDYRITFEHPRLQVLGLAPRGRDVTLAPGDTAIDLAIGSETTLLAEACPVGALGVLVGRITAPDGETPVAGVEVTVRDGAQGSASARTGLDGAYRFCDLSPDAPWTVQWVGYGERVRSDALSPTDAPYRVRHGQVSWAAARAAAADSGTFRASGTVIDAATGRAIPSAAVELIDDDGQPLVTSTTDATGGFQLALPATQGRRDRVARLRVSAHGYVDAAGGRIGADVRWHRVTAELSPEAVAIEGVLVEVEARRGALERLGFFQRAERTAGLFLAPEDLERARSGRTSEMLTRLVPGAQPYQNNAANTTRSFIQLRGAIRASSNQHCLPAVYLDGALVRWGRREGVAEDDRLTSYPSLDELVSGYDVEAIEIYDTPSTIPVAFSGPGSLCGVIVVWTGRGGPD